MPLLRSGRDRPLAKKLQPQQQPQTQYQPDQEEGPIATRTRRRQAEAAAAAASTQEKGKDRVNENVLGAKGEEEVNYKEKEVNKMDGFDIVGRSGGGAVPDESSPPVPEKV